MPWKTMDVREQRVQFVVAAIRKEKPFSALCQEFGISRPTGMLWRERYEREGLAGIAERSRRPHHSPTRTDAEMEQQVVELRRRYPDWGARKLRVVLGREGVELPSSTIHRILLRHDLVRESQRRRQALQRFERSPMNYGRWILKAPRDGTRLWGHCLCSMITAATCWSCRQCGVHVPSWYASSWKLRFSAVGFRRQCSWITAFRGGARWRRAEPRC